MVLFLWRALLIEKSLQLQGEKGTVFIGFSGWCSQSNWMACYLTHAVLNCVQLFATLWTVVCQALLSMGFSRQEYRSGLPFPPPGDVSNPGMKPRSLALWADSLLSETPGKLSKVTEFMHNVSTSLLNPRHSHIRTRYNPVVGRIMSVRTAFFFKPSHSIHVSVSMCT